MGGIAKDAGLETRQKTPRDRYTYPTQARQTDKVPNGRLFNNENICENLRV